MRVSVSLRRRCGCLTACARTCTRLAPSEYRRRSTFLRAAQACGMVGVLLVATVRLWACLFRALWALGYEHKLQRATDTQCTIAGVFLR